MQRRAACRLMLGLLVGVCGCGAPAPEPPTQLPPNRFPTAGRKPKETDAKDKKAGKGTER